MVLNPQPSAHFVVLCFGQPQELDSAISFLGKPAMGNQRAGDSGHSTASPQWPLPGFRLSLSHTATLSLSSLLSPISSSLQSPVSV